MTPVEETPRTQDFYHRQIESAFDLSSCGMGIYTVAVEKLFTDEQCPEWAKASVNALGSNYFKGYVEEWIYPSDFTEKYGPRHFSPHADAHRALINAMHEIYQQWENATTRLLLAGDTSQVEQDLVKPIEYLELSDLLTAAKERGLIDFPFGLDVQNIFQDEGPFHSFMMCFVELYRYGVKIINNNRFDQENQKATSTARIKPLLQKAALYKLGAMLTVTEQITFDAQAEGCPISGDFQPDDPDDKWHRNWQKLFDQPMPTIRELYKQAHSVFVQFADETDPTLSYLFNLPDPQFA